MRLWIQGIKHPAGAIPDESFKVEWNVWYFAWPFKKVVFFIRLLNSKGDILLNEKKEKRIFWFWHQKTKATLTIEESEIFTINAGHET
jgi:hypothetical protein